MTWGIMVENNTDTQSVFIQQLSVPAENLCDFLKSLEDVEKKIIIHVTGTITFKIREDIESVFYGGWIFNKLNITLDLSEVLWDCACCICNWFVDSIILGDDVTGIDGSSIFSPKLKEIKVSEKNVKLSSENGVLYNKDKTILIRYPQAKNGPFVIPDTVEEISASAFKNCKFLNEIKIPNTIKKIGEMAFAGCSLLKEVEVSETTEIENNSFDADVKIIKKNFTIEIPGRYNTAKVFTDNVDSDAYSQILQMMNKPWAEGLSVRIMPDVHAGRGCTIGTTMTIAGQIVPSLVGDDIGCGVDVLVVKKDFCGAAPGELDLALLDEIVHQNIPAGAAARVKPHTFVKQLDLTNFLAPIDIQTAKLQLGTLGGGNHFIEADKDAEGNYYFVIHSGSRHLGKEVCSFYQSIANQNEFNYLSGKDLDNYLHDMNLAQNYAALNRRAMLEEIQKGLGIKKSDILEEFSTIHNYIDLKNRVLRKGAVSAQKGQRLIIPMNMRDGSLICTGKGNADWNFSAPHGAGRLYKRSESKERFTVEEYQAAMTGIYSTSIGHSTLDESPMAYKTMDSILEKITPTVKVEKIIKPIYNFKAGGQ